MVIMAITPSSCLRTPPLCLALGCFGLIATSLCEPTQAAVSNADRFQLAAGAFRTRTAPSNSVTATSVSVAAVLPPATPTNLTATAVSSSQIYLSWTDNSNNETRFRIERSRDGTTFWRINVVGTNVTAYTDSVRQPSTTYLLSGLCG